MMGDEIRKLLNYHDKKSYLYFSQIINFFYTNFDNLTPAEIETLYNELEATRKCMNTPKKVINTLKDGSTIEQEVIPERIKKEDVYPQIYAKYEEYIRTKNTENRTKNIESRTLNTLIKFFNPFKFLPIASKSSIEL